MVGEKGRPQSLVKLAQDRSVQGRRMLARAISDLFADGQAVLSEREHALMIGILNKLVTEFERDLRQDLAERLSDKANAPHDLLLMLANDEIEVARPILIRSGALEDIELIEIIHHRTLEHQLAIAMRSSVSETVSDALVETGNADVVKTLLQNPNAKITEATMAYLVEEARRVDSYQEPLVRRKDLNPELARRMYWHVSAALRAHMLDSFDVDPDVLDEELEGAVLALLEDTRSEAAEPSSKPAVALADCLDKAKQVTPELLVQVLRQGEVALFEALFGRLCGINPPRLQRIIYEPGGHDLAIVCRALNIPKSNFSLIYTMVRRARPGHESLPAKTVSQLMGYFDELEGPAAQQVLRQWRRDPQYLDAIEHTEGSRDGPSG